MSFFKAVVVTPVLTGIVFVVGGGSVGGTRGPGDAGRLSKLDRATPALASSHGKPYKEAIS